MEFVPAIAMVALIWKVVDLLKYIVNKDKNGITTILFVWLAAVGVLFLFAETAWAAEIDFGGRTLGDMNWASLVAVALCFGSSASAAFDFKKAIDRSDSAATPSLVPDAPAPNAVIITAPDGI